ncbi:YdiU family protein [Gammaproteobacteria bacterium]|nr:YdiU family protein [Gammaproteobacteria bacterium]
MLQAESYSAVLPELAFRARPKPFDAPRLLLWNAALAGELDLNTDAEEAAQRYSGQRIDTGCDAVALAYAGHQFGQFVPQLGDGRAHLLGEALDGAGRRLDLQLKGSGRTMFSRNGDGLSALAPALREYLMSESLHALGVPTTRSLAVVASGEWVQRERRQPGGIVTRVAASHLRVGTFQYLAARADVDALERLVDYAITRHQLVIDPQAPRDERALALLQWVFQRQIALVVEWLRVGFIHGVMNTDNCAISGETLDFGPCAMLGVYDPEMVYSSIDHTGRYAFARQPQLMAWNMARLAETLIPLIDENAERAIDRLGPEVDRLSSQFDAARTVMYNGKIGLSAASDNAEMHEALLLLMRDGQLDYTQTFDALTRLAAGEIVDSKVTVALGDWITRWQEHRPNAEVMRSANPTVVPRNHHVETALASAVEGDLKPIKQLLMVLQSPYQQTAETREYQDAPIDGDRDYQTFCGT